MVQEAGEVALKDEELPGTVRHSRIRARRMGVL